MSTDHPDDVAARDRLARQLRYVRERKNLTCVALGDHLEVGHWTVVEREQRRNWQVSLVQEWARALGLRLDLTITGLTVPNDGDPLAVMYAAQQPSTADGEDRLDLRVLVNDLARIRRGQGLRLAELGRRLGCSEGAACRRETHPDRHRLATIQQHTRALGGVLGVELVREGEV